MICEALFYVLQYSLQIALDLSEITIYNMSVSHSTLVENWHRVIKHGEKYIQYILGTCSQ